MVILLVQLIVIVSEFAIGLGVDQYDDCTPTTRSGKIITKENIGPIPDLKVSSMAFVLMGMEFEGGDFEHILDRYPRRVTSKLCLKCLPEKTDDNVIISGCSITEGRTYESGELQFGLGSFPGGFQTIGYVETTGEERRFETPIAEDTLNQSIYGSFTFNGDYYYNFYFHPNNDSPVTLFEYGNQEHLLQVAEFLQSGFRISSHWEVIRSKITTSIIKCENRRLWDYTFVTSLRIFRTNIVESVVEESSFDNETELFRNTTVSDIYRSVMAFKATESIDYTLNISYTGEYKEYTTCGKFNWVYCTPILVSVVITSFLGLFVYWKYSKTEHTRKEVHKHLARNSVSAHVTTVEKDRDIPIKDLSQVPELAFDEAFSLNPMSVVAVRDENGELKAVKVVEQSKTSTNVRSSDKTMEEGNDTEKIIEKSVTAASSNDNRADLEYPIKPGSIGLENM